MAYTRAVSNYDSDSIYSLPARHFKTVQAIDEYYADLDPNGDYLLDLAAITHHAKSHLIQEIAQNNEAKSPEDLAIVLDADDTSISHFLEIKRSAWSNDELSIDARYHAANAPAIPTTLDLFKTARTNGVAVFFISYRTPLPTNPTENLHSYTVQNLRFAGYNDWADVFVPDPVKHKGFPSRTFKTQARAELSKKYKIVLNVGDQHSDVVDGHADRSYRLPNYLYCTTKPEPYTTVQAIVQASTEAKSTAGCSTLGICQQLKTTPTLVLPTAAVDTPKTAPANAPLVSKAPDAAPARELRHSMR